MSKKERDVSPRNPGIDGYDGWTWYTSCFAVVMSFRPHELNGETIINLFIY